MNRDIHIEFDGWFKQNYLGLLAESNRFVTMYLALDLLLKQGGRTLVETGTLRIENNRHDGMSTLVFGGFCKKYQRYLHTVDADEVAMNVCRKATGDYKDFISYNVSDSIAFLKNFNRQIDLLYLDSLDCPEIEYSPQLTASQEHQLREIETAFDKLSQNAIVLLDDNDLVNGGKTRLSKIFLQENGFTEAMSWKQSLWAKNSN